jgi:D-sedoheptulose 7-phosphate isomerase
MTFAESFLAETVGIIDSLCRDDIEHLASALASVRDAGGRLFVIGVGGSAAYAQHAASDFRKLCHFESYTPTDNVAELTARINDDGWDSSFVKWLEGSRLTRDDAILVLSVGGGNREKNVSVNLVNAVELGQRVGAHILGIVGSDGGFTRTAAEASVVIPPMFPEHLTAHTEGLCAVVWHLLVFHPSLRREAAKWESISGGAAR